MQIRAILIRVFDYLADDSDLIAGGDAYGTGWTGVKRERSGDVPEKNYVNLFEREYSRDSVNTRPAIYLGSSAMGYNDQRESRDASSGYLVEHRLLMVPLIITAFGSTYYDAQDKRDQLVFNVRKVLWKLVVDNPNTGVPYWYNLRLPGRAGGGELAIVGRVSGTGQNEDGVYEAQCLLPVAISYQLSKNTPRA